MTKRSTRSTKERRDVFDQLGSFIGDRIRQSFAKPDNHKNDSRGKNGGAEGGDFMAYFKHFLDDRSIASVTPSSKYIVDRVIKMMDVAKSDVVVEYGPAEGVITHRILKNLKPSARLIAVEFNATLFATLSKEIKDPRLTPINGDVRKINDVLDRLGVGKIDVVTSGVPFSFFSPQERRDLVSDTADRLNPGGRFVAYQATTYVLPLLKKYFSKVDVQFEVRNIPPHFIFTATK